MPQTRYTEFCNHSFDLVLQIGRFALDHVKPAMERLRDEAANRDAKRDVAVYSTYLTIVAWLQTFTNLNHTYDFQAVGSGSRAIFERYLDLQWFEKFKEPEWVERFMAFSNVDRYLTAKKVLSHIDKGGSELDPAVYSEAMNNGQSIEALVARLWGMNSEGTPRWPKFHWTGVPQLSERAKAVGMDALDAYYRLYPPFSWLVHSGPTAYFGCDFENIEAKVAWCHFFSFQMARGATIVATRQLNIEGAIPGFEEVMNRLWILRQDALSKLPK